MSRPRDEDNPLENAVLERMDMALAQILGVKDRIDYLTDVDAGRLRGVVLRELNEFADLCIALLRAAVDSSQVNEVAIDLLREIHGAVVERVPSG